MSPLSLGLFFISIHNLPDLPLLPSFASSGTKRFGDTLAGYSICSLEAKSTLPNTAATAKRDPLGNLDYQSARALLVIYLFFIYWSG